MRRFFCLLLSVLAVTLLLFACAPGPAASVPPPESGGMNSGTGMLPASADIALITTEARFTSDFGQAVWNTITRFAGETGLGSGNYKTEEDNPEACLATLELAAKAGAQMVIAMGESVSQALATVQGQYPDIYFVLLDTSGPLELQDNSVSVAFSVEQAAWLAGYYAARETTGPLGVALTDTDDAKRCALGFLLGVQASLDALEVEPEPQAVLLLTLDDAHYKKRRTYIDQMYASGAHLMFAATADLWPAALPTAQGMGYQLIGVGLPMTGTSNAALAGIEEDPKNLVYNLLDAWANNNFPGGNAITGTVAGGDIIVQTEPWRFKRMQVWLQKKGLESFDSGMLALSLASRLRPDADGNLPEPEDLPLNLLTVRQVDPDAPDALDADSSVVSAPASTPPVTPGQESASPPETVTPEPPPASESAPPPDSTSTPKDAVSSSAPESPSVSESLSPPDSTPEPDSDTAPESEPPPESSSSSADSPSLPESESTPPDASTAVQSAP